MQVQKRRRIHILNSNNSINNNRNEMKQNETSTTTRTATTKATQHNKREWTCTHNFSRFFSWTHQVSRDTFCCLLMTHTCSSRVFYGLHTIFTKREKRKRTENSSIVFPWKMNALQISQRIPTFQYVTTLWYSHLYSVWGEEKVSSHKICVFNYEIE